MKNESLYEPLDIFMVRTPLKPINKYFEYFENENSFEKEKEDIETKEAILIGSASLYESIYKDNSKSDKVKHSFEKYYNRMTSRTTPYGLFAGVNIGGFSDHTNMNLDKYTKYVYPDMEWLDGVIKVIKKDRNILDSLTVMSNNVLVSKGNRLDNIYYTNNGSNVEKMRDSRYVSIRNTNIVKYILSITKNPIKVGEIIKNLKDNIDVVPESYISNIVYDLIDKEFLLTEIDGVSYEERTLINLINKLEHIITAKEYYEKLKKISRYIKEYEELEIGRGIDTYLELLNCMKEIYECKNYIQVDMKSNFNELKLNNEIKNEIIQLSNFLYKFTELNIIKDEYEKYKFDFIEKYGGDRLVPILEVVDKDKGIGLPRTFERYVIDETSKDFIKIKEILINKYVKCLKNNSREIKVTEDDFNHLRSNSDLDFDKLPLSYDINLLIKMNPESNNHLLFLGPNVGAIGAGKTFGRFKDLYNNDDLNKLRKINDIEKELLNMEVITVELRSNFNIKRLLNVSRTFDMRDTSLYLSQWDDNSESLKLDDLYMGIENNNFYLWSASNNCRIQISKNHMLNSIIVGGLYKFIIDLSKDNNMFVFLNILNIVFGLYEYVPRISFGNIILSPEMWKINATYLKLSKNYSLEEFESKLKVYIKEFNIPELVYLTDGDNRLLLDLKRKDSIKVIYENMKKRSNSILTEVDFDISKHAIMDEEGNGYNSEFIIPIVRKVKNKEYKYNKNFSINSEDTYSNKRNILPMGNWVYMNLFCSKNRDDELITDYILEFIDVLKANKLIKKSFFIRYIVDDKYHIRLRIEKNKGINIDNNIDKFLQNLKENFLISKVSIDTYERELERYGGIDVYEEIEEYFDIDSECVCRLLKACRKNKINLDMKIIGVISIIKMMEDFGLSFSEQLELLDEIIDKKMFREEFNNHRKELIYLANSNNEWFNLMSSEEGKYIMNILMLRTNSLKKLSYEFQNNKKIFTPYNGDNELLRSLIHMNCNRLFGIERKLELEVLAYVRHTLYCLKHFKK